MTLKRNALRPLLREGRGLLHYTMNEVPPKWLVRRYARAVLRRAEHGAVFPRWLATCPKMTRLVEPVSATSATQVEMAERLWISCAIVETCSPGGRLLLTSEQPRLAAVFNIGIAVAIDGVLIPVRWIVARLIR